MEVKRVFEVPESRPYSLSGRMSEKLIGVVHQAIGNASMCWENPGGAGVFDCLHAGDIALELCHTIADELDACGRIESTIKRRQCF